MSKANERDGVKIADILEAITEAYKEHLITTAYYNYEGFQNIQDFKDNMPFDEILLDDFNIEVADECSNPAFEDSVFTKILKNLKAKDYNIKENWDNAPPVTARIEP